jgi:hypothetical protein
MISSVLINKKFNKETMNIEEKAKEILRSKLTDIDLDCYLKGSTLTYNACLEAVKEAINYTHCCTELKEKKAIPFDDWTRVKGMKLLIDSNYRWDKTHVYKEVVHKMYEVYLINL